MRLQFAEFAQELEKILAWLPKNYSIDEVANLLANLQLFPAALPTTVPALEVYHSILRVSLMLQENRSFQSTNGQFPVLQIPEKITEISRNFAEALLIFLDGVQPTGVFDVEAKDIKLASCFCFEGQVNLAKPREIIAEVTIDFGIPQKQKLQILADQIVKIGLRAGFTAEVRIKTSGNFKINSAKKFSKKVTGAELGLVFDGRCRPIVAPGAAGDRVKRVTAWRQALESVTEFKGIDF